MNYNLLKKQLRVCNYTKYVILFLINRSSYFQPVDFRQRPTLPSDTASLSKRADNPLNKTEKRQRQKHGKNEKLA